MENCLGDLTRCNEGIQKAQSIDLSLVEKELQTQLNDYDQQLYFYLRDLGCDHEYALEHLEDVVYYEGMNLGEVVEELLGQEIWGAIPDYLRGYLDYEKLERTLEIDGYHETDQGVFYYV